MSGRYHGGVRELWGRKEWSAEKMLRQRKKDTTKKSGSLLRVRVCSWRSDGSERFWRLRIWPPLIPHPQPRPLPDVPGSSVKAPVFGSVGESHQRVLAPHLQWHGAQQQFCRTRSFLKEKVGEPNRPPQPGVPVSGFHRQLRGGKISEGHATENCKPIFLAGSPSRRLGNASRCP